MILSIDTYSEVLGISILNNGSLIYRLSLYKVKPFSEVLIDKLDYIFKELDLKKKDIKAVVINKGPGGYTGLRVGISTAKSIAYVLNTGIYAYESLSALAYKYRYIDGKILVCINAGKSEAYIQEFHIENKKVKPTTEIKLGKQKVLKNTDFKDFSLVITKNIDLDGYNIVSDMEDLSLHGAFYSLENQLKEDLYKLEPVYIRKL